MNSDSDSDSHSGALLRKCTCPLKSLGTAAPAPAPVCMNAFPNGDEMLLQTVPARILLAYTVQVSVDKAHLPCDFTVSIPTTVGSMSIRRGIAIPVCTVDAITALSPTSIGWSVVTTNADAGVWNLMANM